MSPSCPLGILKDKEKALLGFWNNLFDPLGGKKGIISQVIRTFVQSISMDSLTTVCLSLYSPNYTILHLFPFSNICRVLLVLDHMLLRVFLAFPVESAPLGYYAFLLLFTELSVFYQYLFGNKLPGLSVLSEE